MQQETKWHQTRLFKLGLAGFSLTLFLLLTLAKFDVEETGFESLAYNTHPIIAILVSDIPLTGFIASLYFFIVNK